MNTRLVPEEIEFLVRARPSPPARARREAALTTALSQAEDELVTIIPKFKLPELRFIAVRAACADLTPAPREGSQITPLPARCPPHPTWPSAGALPSTQGTFGPFEPQIPVEVPLWLAISLKKQHKCQVKAPDWLDDGAGAAPHVPPRPTRQHGFPSLVGRGASNGPRSRRHRGSADRLKERFNEERSTEGTFSDVHSNYLEIASLLFR